YAHVERTVGEPAARREKLVERVRAATENRAGSSLVHAGQDDVLHGIIAAILDLEVDLQADQAESVDPAQLAHRGQKRLLWRRRSRWIIVRASSPARAWAARAAVAGRT